MPHRGVHPQHGHLPPNHPQHARTVLHTLEHHAPTHHAPTHHAPTHHAPTHHAPTQHPAAQFANRAANTTTAVAYFVGQGWTRAQAIGIVANIDAESKMNPNQAQIGGGPAYGLGQWEGPRQASFRAWAGKTVQNSTFDEQLAFIQYELTTTEPGAGRALRRTKTVGEAAEVITRRYERPKNVETDVVKRVNRAHVIAKGHKKP
jgi:hypothetical protein